MTGLTLLTLNIQMVYMYRTTFDPKQTALCMLMVMTDTTTKCIFSDEN